jgi:hypothetical protein
MTLADELVDRVEGIHSGEIADADVIKAVFLSERPE